MSQTQVEKEIAKEQAEIEKRQERIRQIQATQFLIQLKDAVNHKDSSEEEIAGASKAFYDNYVLKVRRANIAKAQEARKNKKQEAVAPTPSAV